MGLFLAYKYVTVGLILLEVGGFFRESLWKNLKRTFRLSLSDERWSRGFV